jgi:hydrogenase maturation factor
LTKGIPLEGTSIIAREKESNLVELGISQQEIQESKDLLYNPGISVIREALLAVQNFEVHAMHDPTEGGLAMGLVELARASKCGFIIDFEKIPINPLGKRLCELFNLNPLQTISSGSLLIVVTNEDSEQLLSLLKRNDILASKIGVLTAEQRYLITTGNVQKEIKYSEKDEITKIFRT